MFYILFAVYEECSQYMYLSDTARWTSVLYRLYSVPRSHLPIKPSGGFRGGGGGGARFPLYRELRHEGSEIWPQNGVQILSIQRTQVLTTHEKKSCVIEEFLGPKTIGCRYSLYLGTLGGATGAGPHPPKI